MSKFFLVLCFLFYANLAISQCKVCDDGTLNKIQYYVNNDFFDSAQTLIYETNARKSNNPKDELYYYYLAQNQVEVFFFSGLIYFGIDAANEALKKAKALNDSLSIAITNEYLGLQFQVLGDLKNADWYYKNAANYFPAMPNYTTHRNKFGKANILQSLAEMQMLKGNLDSAIYFNKAAFSKYKESADFKIKSIILFTFGDIYLEMSKIDSAMHYYQLSLNESIDSSFFDLELFNYANIAYCKAKFHKFNEAEAYIQNGLDLLKINKSINAFYVDQFYEKVIETYQLLNNETKLIYILNLQKEFQKTKNSKSNIHLQKTLLAFTEKENEIASLQLKEALFKTQKAKFYNVLLVIIIAGIMSFVLFIKYRQDRLNKQKQYLHKEKERITSDLHDDLGVGLTSIKMLSELALIKYKNVNSAELQKIKNYATTLVQSLSDIVWEMNEKHDKNFIQYVIVYATEYCNEHNINFNYYVDENVKNIVIDGLKRRNLFLVIKETLHNTIKHANATQINIKFLLQNSQLIITIHDNGKGIDTENLRAFGNGLKNMQSRMNAIHGSYAIENNKGTLTTLILPI